MKVKARHSYHSEMNTVSTLGYLVPCVDSGYLCSWILKPSHRSYRLCWEGRWLVQLVIATFSRPSIYFLFRLHSGFLWSPLNVHFGCVFRPRTVLRDPCVSFSQGQLPLCSHARDRGAGLASFPARCPPSGFVAFVSHGVMEVDPLSHSCLWTRTRCLGVLTRC